MSTTSASRDAKTTSEQRALVWDMPVRVFHWLMVLCFAGAYATAESERLRLLHVTLGYTMAGLVAFRLLWGLIGTRYARFTQFVKGPAAVLRYLKSLLSGSPEHHLGHNPAGAVAIVLLLLLTIFISISGYMTYNELGGHLLEEAHEALGNAMLLVVLVHVAGVIVSSWLHKEPLVGAMIHGYKPAAPGEGVSRAWRLVALLILAAVLGFWSWQWMSRPAASVAASAVSLSKSA